MDLKLLALAAENEMIANKYREEQGNIFFYYWFENYNV